MLKRHRRFPLGTVVMVKTDDGYVKGKVLKHCGLSEFWTSRVHRSVCIVWFKDSATINGFNHFSHWLPLRNLKRIKAESPEYGPHVKPWFMNPPYK